MSKLAYKEIDESRSSDSARMVFIGLFLGIFWMAIGAALGYWVAGWR